MPTSPIKTLTFQDLSFERNQHLLFSNVHGSLKAGEMLQIRGANGSGKSTLLRILAGFIAPLTGAIHWEENPILANPENYQQQLHYLGHHNGIKQNLTVYENLKLSAALLSLSLQPQKAKDILKQMGLTHKIHTQALHLSAGQLRRLSLARLLLTTNSLWILDEPTTALDAEGQHLFSNMVKQQLENNGIIIFATHQDILLTPAMKTLTLGEQDA